MQYYQPSWAPNFGVRGELTLIPDKSGVSPPHSIYLTPRVKIQFRSKAFAACTWGGTNSTLCLYDS